MPKRSPYMLHRVQFKVVQDLKIIIIKIRREKPPHMYNSDGGF